VVALAVVSACLVWAGSALAQPAVYVFPTPGTSWNLPQQQITFRGVPASQIGNVQVTGSSSGAHTGKIEADSDGDGGSFIPNTPFTGGETVTVTTGLNIVGGTNGSFSFKVATPFPGAFTPLKLPMVPAGSNGVQHFHSQPSLEPASITVNSKSKSAYNGDIFLTPQYGPLQNGPMILDSSGNLIWFQPLPANELAADFRVQQYEGQPVLTWFQGYTNNGSGDGEGVIYNTSYQQIATVQAANGVRGMDLHEFLLTPQGDAWIVGISPVVYPGEKTRPLMDAVVQEIDIKTGLVLFEWHALDHIPISESYFKTNAPGLVYDPYHLNSISLDTDGNLILSMRNTWGVYKVNVQTGAVMWTLGTNQNQFKRGPGTSTAFQHDVLVQPGGTFTMFDDGGGPPTVRAGRAIKVAVNESTKTVTLVKQYQHNPPLDTNFEGNAQELPNGDLFVGWGQQPYFTEFNASGKQIFDARFTSNTSSYRAYRFQWTGQPTTPPSIAAGANNDTTSEVWASWNGATTVSSWRVLAGPSAGALTTLETVGRHGFETGISASTGMPYFAVQALGSSGQVLGTTATVSVGPHIGVAGRSAFVSAASGTGAVPALCDNSQTCHIAVTLKVGRTVIGSTGREDIPAEGGGLIYFTLNRTGRSMLAHARGRRLLVYMTGQDISKLSFGRYITLVPFSASGSAPARSASQSSTLRILGLTDFVSSGGVGGLLAECLGTSPCHASTSLSVGGKTIASTGTELIGARGEGYLIFSLNSTGRSLLAHAHGNQLGAAVTITDGGATAHGSVVLVGFR
jgi:Arylsulfotransferase (ASST)